MPDMQLRWRHLTRENVPGIFLLLVIFQAIHSTEECLTRLIDWFPVVTGKVHDAIGFFPIIIMSGGTFAAINVMIVAVLLLVGRFVFRQRRWAWRIAPIIAVIEILNGLLHATAAVVTGGYYPGSISGVGLTATAILLLISFGRKAWERPARQSGEV